MGACDYGLSSALNPCILQTMDKGWLLRADSPLGIRELLGSCPDLWKSQTGEISMHVFSRFGCRRNPGMQSYALPAAGGRRIEGLGKAA